jgi:hypothetical protein
MFQPPLDGIRIMDDGNRERSGTPVSEQAPFRPATSEEIEETLSFALRFKGRKRAEVAGPMVAQIAAEHLRLSLEASGFVVMKRPTGPAPSTTQHHRRAEGEA